jgi:hypothetical protein
MYSPQFLGLHHGYSQRDVAVNGHIQCCDQYYRLKRSVSLGYSFENEQKCGFPGGCHENVACYLPINAANSQY